jgi:hypothetical protein
MDTPSDKLPTSIRQLFPPSMKKAAGRGNPAAEGDVWGGLMAGLDLAESNPPVEMRYMPHECDAFSSSGLTTPS